MRRQHNTFGGGSPLPAGCMFYAPLTQGDLTDHVSGSVGSPLNAPSGNMTWDNASQAYRFYCTSNYQNCLVFPMTDLQTRWNGATDWTWVVDIKKIGTTTYIFLIGYSKSGDMGIYDYGFSLNHLASYQSQISSTQFDRFCVVYNSALSRLEIYKNGVLIGTSNQPSSYLGAPTNWKEHYWENITLGASIGGNLTTNAYYKNAYLFNRVLTTDEMMAL